MIPRESKQVARVYYLINNIPYDCFAWILLLIIYVFWRFADRASQYIYLSN